MTYDPTMEKTKRRTENKLKSSHKKNYIRIKNPSKKTNATSRGVVYLGHIPHGFYEEGIRDYCKQFGTVTRVRVARSKHTGRSKGYAFIEFLHDEVAKIVAETLNNYLMFNRLLKCEYLPPEKRHKKMFLNTISSLSYPKLKKQENSTALKNDEKNKDSEKSIFQRRREKLKKYESILENHGVKFDIEVYDPSGFLKANQKEKKETENILEIDESDEEVRFKTPPNAKKVFKRASMGTPKIGQQKK